MAKEKSQAKAPTPEVKKSKETGKKIETRTAPKIPNFSPDNRGIFNSMSEGGRAIAAKAYQGLEKIPGVDRTVGKLQIAYNQFWLNRNEKKSVGFKSKMDGLEMQVGFLDQAKESLKASIEDLKAQGIPGVESLQLELKNIDKKKIDLLNKKDTIQSKMESRVNKTKMRANERDAIADKLINRFDEKLKPMEKELERLQTNRDQADLVIAVTEARHKKLAENLDKTEERKQTLEAGLRQAGMSERKIKNNPAVKKMESTLASGRKNIKSERDKLMRDRNKIDRKIAKVDDKANSHRDRREEFSRVKEGRPINIEAKAREKGGTTARESSESHPREEGRTKSEETIPTSRPERTATAEKEKRMEVGSMVLGWNLYLKEKHGKEQSAGEQINISEFEQATMLHKSYKLDYDDFKNILGHYLKLKKIPLEKYYQSIDNYYEDKLKPAEA